MDYTAVRELLSHHYQYTGRDETKAHEIYALPHQESDFA